MSERKLAVTRLPLQWLLCLALLGSCSGLTEPSGSNAEVGESSSGDLVPATSSEVSAAGIDPPVVERSVEPMTLAEIFYKGHAIVEGDVVEVGKLKWNQESGEPWTLADSPEAFAEPQAYRVARLEHVKVTRSDDRADGLVGGDSVQVTFPVDFESDGSEVPVGGGFAKGDHVVVALYYGFLAEREGYVDHLYPVGHELGVFFRSVDGDYQRRITTYPVLGSGDAALVESPAFVAAEADPISQAALVNLIELSRLTDVPGWDRDRQGVSAAEKANTQRAIPIDCPLRRHPHQAMLSQRKTTG